MLKKPPWRKPGYKGGPMKRMDTQTRLPDAAFRQKYLLLAQGENTRTARSDHGASVYKTWGWNFVFLTVKCFILV